MAASDGAVGAISAASWDCTAGSELQDFDSGTSGKCDNTNCDNSVCLDGRHACARKPSNFAGDEASWKSWSFVMLSFSAAVSPELRALMEKVRTTADDMRNVNLTPAEQVWSRQLYYMLNLSTSGEAQRRLQNVPEGEGAEAWKAFSEHYEPKTATRYVGMLKQIILYDFGELTQFVDRIEQFRHLLRKYGEQSGESVTDNVRQAVLQAGIKDASIRDHLALHAGRLNSFD